MHLSWWFLLVDLVVAVTFSHGDSTPSLIDTTKDKTLSNRLEDQKITAHRVLRGERDANFIVGDEERVLPFKLEVFISKLKKTVNNMKPNNRNLIKMEKMFEQGTTPETLYKLYGSTKKLRLQQEFREFYKWRISWRNQRAYPRPGLVKP